MRIYTIDEIEQAIDVSHILKEIEQGLSLANQGKVLSSPTAFMHFNRPKGDVHIKSAAFADGEMYVVKIASGFYENFKFGFPSSNGVMLLFSQKTGELIAILQDEGRLTNIRTAAAGAIAAKYLAPAHITKIGIIGTGTQAKEQLFHLQHVIPCRDVLVWGRDRKKAEALALNPYLKGFHITVAESIDEIASQCSLIITATNSSKPLLFGHQIQPGTHITAVGADDQGKQELDETVFACADLIVADSIVQCASYGDLSHAKNIDLDAVIELGKLVQAPIKRKTNWITVADLTGVAIEDLQIAKAVYESCIQKLPTFPSNKHAMQK